MKKLISTLLACGLLLSVLSACGDEKTETTSGGGANTTVAQNAESTTAAENTSAAAIENTTAAANATEAPQAPAVETTAKPQNNDPAVETTAKPQNNDPAVETTAKPQNNDPAVETTVKPDSGNSKFPADVTYKEEYVNESDPGDNLSPEDDALKLVNYFNEHSYFLGGIKEITYSGLVVINNLECYYYNVLDEVPNSGRCAIDYQTGEMFVFVEESGEFEAVNKLFSNSDDTLEWWGTYSNGEFSITINNFNGESFNFVISNLRNGQPVLEGVAVIDPADKNLAMYGQCGIYFNEDTENIEFFSPESGEWAHLRGEYTQV